MKIGTRSVLMGAHCFLIHPGFVALAWWKLYGFPFDPRLWVAFFVHDLGYWGKANMDDAEGERHVEWGARVMTRLFDGTDVYNQPGCIWIQHNGEYLWPLGKWGQLSLLHSRYYAKKHDVPFSRLCVADKLAIALEPWWFYLPRVIASGEVWEYLKYARGEVDSVHGDAAESEYARRSATMRGWHGAMTEYCRNWVAEHRDGREDTWTKK